MARKYTPENPGFAKLLDAWVPPSDAGVAIGCVGTSYTFSPEFFEEQCLTRFVQMQSDPDDDGPVYVVEREEKFAQLRCAAALVDQHHCIGHRSLRWDLLSARLPRGLLHAKVALLHWSNLVRVIVTSANITEDGYRRNQEVFGVLDFQREGDSPLSCLRLTIGFLRQAATHSQVSSDPASPPLTRWNQLLDEVTRSARGWGIDANEERLRPLRVSAAFSGKGYPPIISTLQKTWPAISAATTVSVVSPFFDATPTKNTPAEEIWALLRKRGDPKVRYIVVVEQVPGEAAGLIYAPDTLLKAHPTSPPGASTEFRQLSLDEARRLHAKAIWVEDDRWALYLIGSSNFTSAGLGLSKSSNLEANLVYIVDGNKDRKAYDRLMASFPKSERIAIDKNTKWKPLSENDEDEAVDSLCLPSAFGTATYDFDQRRGGEIRLSFPEKPPAGWYLLADGQTDPCLSESEWAASGSHPEARLQWDSKVPPSGFWVRWRESEGSAWWQVNILSAAALPPPEELRDLPLEVLISILSSARPLHRVLGEFLRRRKERASMPNTTSEVDPHKRVDTSQFLLQRTRRISAALVR